ncbi:SDR family NAD(P)-dependent oxidoreductase [Bacillus sp. V2I10]|uniref:SDR family NAD(P)-dependent oxidoreductase n=1 Tax=Bacillus sp. V2I10 TaxID=3042276 RepID=UPI002784E147|nr:SDR family NAD(P)-dependent oxidoreductase [Bacillus sp. V2I10]MDQ0857187.1 NAD(P)-dependent dehydrogenase (short-subunit alcohol dehydrogenase family) [Bacillus sp. V2I10]
MRLKDKVVLITGAGSGIGKSAALLFAREGASVVVNDLDSVKGGKTASEIIEFRGDAFFLQADVTNPISVKSMVEEAINKYKRIDVLFNNAGISGVGKLHETNLNDWDQK